MTELDDRILQQNVEYHQFPRSPLNSPYYNVSLEILKKRGITSNISQTVKQGTSVSSDPKVENKMENLLTYGENEKKELFNKMVESMFHINWEMDVLLQLNIHLSSNLAKNVVTSIQEIIESCKEIISEELFTPQYHNYLNDELIDEETMNLKMGKVQKELCQRIVDDINFRVKYESNTNEHEKVKKDTEKITVLKNKIAID